MKNSVLFGLLGGFISSALLAVLYVSDKNYLLLGYEKLSWLLIFAAMIIAVLRERNSRQEQFISFYEALRTAFQTFIFAYLIKFSFIYILFNYVDPELLDIAREKAVQIFIAHRNMEIPESIFEQQVEAFKSGHFGPRLFDIGIMLEIIGGFVLSAISAALWRRDKPEYEK